MSSGCGCPYTTSADRASGSGPTVARLDFCELDDQTSVCGATARSSARDRSSESFALHQILKLFSAMIDSPKRAKSERVANQSARRKTGLQCDVIFAYP